MLPTITYRNPQLRRRNSDTSELDRLFDGFLGRPVLWANQGSADLFETEDEYVLELEIPGYREEDVEITVERGMLTVSGSLSQEEENSARTYHLRERSRERFARTFQLSESISAGDVSADMEGGILTVRMPKAPEAKPRKVEVNVR